MPFVCRAGSIDVNPCVDAATSEVDTKKRGMTAEAYPLIWVVWLAAQVHLTFPHLPWIVQNVHLGQFSHSH